MCGNSAVSGNCPDRAVHSSLLRCTLPNGFGKECAIRKLSKIRNKDMIIERKNVILNSMNDGPCAVYNGVQVEVYEMYLGKWK
jgi:hypothetical protein